MKKLIFTLQALFLCLMVSAQTVKFAVITDLHSDIMHDARERLETFLDAAKKEKVDFIINLGDFAEVKEKNRPMVELWNSFPGNKYFALGNHDHECSTKEEYMKFVEMDRNYYSFDKGGIHFIVLDPNFLCIDGEYLPYDKGNFYKERSKRAHIDLEQAKWLKHDLRNTDKRCVVFSHQSLENTVSNRTEIRAILEAENQHAGYQKVVAAFSGHSHTNYEKKINGIAYIQINSASNHWLGHRFECASRFDEQINKDYPLIKFVAPYRDCLYAIVKINKHQLKLKGRSSSFIKPTPSEMKVPQNYGNVPVVAYIKDFCLKF